MFNTDLDFQLEKSDLHSHYTIFIRFLNDLSALQITFRFDGIQAKNHSPKSFACFFVMKFDGLLAIKVDDLYGVDYNTGVGLSGVSSSRMLPVVDDLYRVDYNTEVGLSGVSSSRMLPVVLLHILLCLWALLSSLVKLAP